LGTGVLNGYVLTKKDSSGLDVNESEEEKKRARYKLYAAIAVFAISLIVMGAMIGQANTDAAYIDIEKYHTWGMRAADPAVFVTGAFMALTSGLALGYTLTNYKWKDITDITKLRQDEQRGYIQ